MTPSNCRSHAKSRGRKPFPVASLACLILLIGCGPEARPVSAGLPLTPPDGSDDPRIAHYQGNAYHVAQGGRYYLWYGCDACHASGSRDGPDLGTGRWRHGDTFDAVYQSIARLHRMPYADRMPIEPLWQVTAYVRQLPTIDPEKRRRLELDLASEPRPQAGAEQPR